MSYVEQLETGQGVCQVARYVGNRRVRQRFIGLANVLARMDEEP